nr:hypothetical protein [Tanacetum cinerariifolium]
MLDFDDEDEDEGEEQNEEFILHSTNTMECLMFGSCKDKEDVDDQNNSFEDLNSPIKEQDKESVPFKVGEEVMEANTTPYLPTLEEPILSLIDDIRSKEDECSNSLEEEQYPTEVEAEVTHILNPPQLPRVAINQVGGMTQFSKIRKNKKRFHCFFFFSSIAVQTSSSGISNLLAVATTFTASGNLYCQWELLTWQ